MIDCKCSEFWDIYKESLLLHVLHKFILFWLLDWSEFLLRSYSITLRLVNDSLFWLCLGYVLPVYTFACILAQNTRLKTITILFCTIRSPTCTTFMHSYQLFTRHTLIRIKFLLISLPQCSVLTPYTSTTLPTGYPCWEAITV